MPVPPELTDKTRGIRLQKAMAQAGVASRRHCEQLIEEGRVRVNEAAVTELPAWVDPAHDVIEVDDKPIRRARSSGRDAGNQPRKAGNPPHTYLMVNKPRRVISTSSDPHGRTGVLDLIDAPIVRRGKDVRLFPVGRLDADSTGLILLTDDGDLAHRLTHPSYEVPKQYQVSVRGRVEHKDLERLRRGLFLADHPSNAAGEPGRPRPRKDAAKKTAMERVRIVGYERDVARGDRTALSVTLREGRNREIRRLLARLGFKVRRLHRTAIGPLKLKGVPLGGWRPLTATEVGMLRKAAGLNGATDKLG